MKKILLFLAVIFTCATAASAQKTTTDTDKQEMTDLLCHKWHATHFEAQGQRQPMEQGEDGSYVLFKKDGSTESADATGKGAAGKWSYNPATHILTVTEQGDNIEQTIEKLTDKELVLKIADKAMGEIGLVLRRVD